MGGGTSNYNLAGTSQKKVQSTDDILKQIESTLSESGQEEKFKQEELSARILGKISQHEAAFGDRALPRQRLPKVDAVLLDRYNAARRNLLVLGAIQASRPNTHRSNKGSNSNAASSKSTEHRDDGEAKSGGLDDDDPSAANTGLESTFTSFNGSRSGSPSRMARHAPSEGDLSAEPSGVIGAEASQTSISGRRMRHQVSGRSAASSSGGSAAGTSLGTARSRLRHVNSSLSTGSSHTLRSEVRSETTSTGSKYSHHSHFGRKTPRRSKPAKPKPGRVATALAAYGSKDDWMSKTLLKHYLASVIQARWRGYQVRKRWAEQASRAALVEEEKAKQQAPAVHQQRLQELQQKLLARQAKQQAQATAAAVAAAAADDEQGTGSAAGPAAAAGLSAGQGAVPVACSGLGSVSGSRGASAVRRLAGSRVLSAASGASALGKAKLWQSLKHAAACSDSYIAQDRADSDSDSGWSDIELEDVASIKFRAVTPPWQRVGEQACMSQQLKRRTAAAAAAATGQPLPEGWSLGDEFAGLGLAWNSCSSSNECSARLQELRHRRICHKPEPIQLSDAAVAAAAASGLLANPEDPGAAATTASSAGVDAAGTPDLPLPRQAVEELLLDRYSKKYARMGMLERMPARQKWLKLQAERPAAEQKGADEALPAAAAAAAAATVPQGQLPAVSAAALPSTTGAAAVAAAAAAVVPGDASAASASGVTGAVPVLPPVKGAT